MHCFLASSASNSPGRHSLLLSLAEEKCFRTVLDLREVAQKLDMHKFQEKARVRDDVDNKAMFVPGDKFLSMFDSSIWTHCFSEFWYGRVDVEHV